MEARELKDIEKDLFQNMVHPNVEKRCTIEQILEHQWMKAAVVTHPIVVACDDEVDPITVERNDDPIILVDDDDYESSTDFDTDRSEHRHFRRRHCDRGDFYSNRFRYRFRTQTDSTQTDFEGRNNFDELVARGLLAVMEDSPSSIPATKSDAIAVADTGGAVVPRSPAIDVSATNSK